MPLWPPGVPRPVWASSISRLYSRCVLSGGCDQPFEHEDLAATVQGAVPPRWVKDRVIVGQVPAKHHVNLCKFSRGSNCPIIAFEQ